MADLNITFDNEQMRGLLHESILASITPEMRESMIREAVAQLTAPKESAYGRKDPSTLQMAFKVAVDNLAAQLAREVLEESAELREQIKEKVVEMVTAFVASDYNAGDVFARVFADVFQARR
jgi:hypothetical protein